MLLLLLSLVARATEPLDAYLDARLEVAEGPVSTVYARGYDGSGRFWFVVDAEHRTLDARSFATRIGDDEGLATLDRRRRHRRAAAGTLFCASGLLIASAFAPVVLAPARFGDPTGPDLRPLMFGSAALGAGGLVGGTLVLGRGVRDRHPSAIYDRDEAEQRVRDHNAALRDELLGPADPPG